MYQKIPTSINASCYLYVFCKKQRNIVIFFVSLHVYSLLDEAVDENDGDPTTLAVSGDGTWQRRGFKSMYGVAAVLSCNAVPKVLDVQRLSKKCVICTGTLSVRNTDPDFYDEIINNHDCESNYDGSSSKLRFVYQIAENKSMENFFF